MNKKPVNRAGAEAPVILGIGSRYTVQPGKNNSTPRQLVSLPADRIMHTHVIGKSRSGKSRWLASYFVMLLHAGINCTLIDPAGDLSQLILGKLVETGYFERPDALDTLLYLDIPRGLRERRYLPFNVLHTGHDPHTTADMVLEAFKRAWPVMKDGSATTIETLVKMSSYVLAAQGIPLLPFMTHLLTDKVYRERVLVGLEDSEVRSFWQRYQGDKEYRQQSIEPTLKRIGLIGFAPVLRYSLGQPENVLDFRQIFGEQRSVLINLNLPDLDAMRFLGCLLTVNAEMAAKGRLEQPEVKRQGRHMLILDEFQNFTAQSSDALGHILEECAKANVFLCVAHQSWKQVPEQLRGALHNCDIEVAFKLERPDARLSEAFLKFPYNPYLAKPRPITSLNAFSAPPQMYSRDEQEAMHVDDIMQLQKREAFLRLPDDSLYHIRSLDVADPNISSKALQEVESSYFERYFRSEQEVEASIARQRGYPSVHSSEESQNATIVSDTKKTTPDVHDFDEDIYGE